MSPRHFLRLADLSRTELLALLDRADAHRQARRAQLGSDPARRAQLGSDPGPPHLAGKTVAIVLEKASTRTRISFEVAVHELGGHPIVLSGQGSQLARGEPIEDTARVLSRFVHAIVFRTFGHDRLEALARHATVPVIDALTDDHHPCQILADLQTVRRERGVLHPMRVAWIGDGNNVARSWIEAAQLLGFTLVLACPEGYDPPPSSLGGDVHLVRDPDEAIRGAHVVTTDVWASMGQEEESAKRRAGFADYAVNEQRMRSAASDAIFLHCLPAHRGEEVEAAVIDGPQSRVWDEAEDRLHTSKALLEMFV